MTGPRQTTHGQLGRQRFEYVIILKGWQAKFQCFQTWHVVDTTCLDHTENTLADTLTAYALILRSFETLVCRVRVDRYQGGVHAEPPRW